MKIISRCPSCNSTMVIREVECPKCGLTIRGTFDRENFMDLPDGMLNFMLIFIKNRGNIKEVEKELDISYPTVRNKLDDLIELLGFPVSREQEDYKSARLEILEKLGSGELSATEAAERLKRL